MPDFAGRIRFIKAAQVVSRRRSALTKSYYPDRRQRMLRVASFIGWYLICLTVLGLFTAGLVGLRVASEAKLRSDLQHSGIRVAGTAHEDAGKSYFADLRFKTREGHTVATSYITWPKFPEYQESRSAGDSDPVDIVYDPQNPSRAIPAPFAKIPSIDAHAQFLDIFSRYFFTLEVFAMFATLAVRGARERGLKNYLASVYSRDTLNYRDDMRLPTRATGFSDRAPGAKPWD
jgi:hypothetical protein